MEYTVESSSVKKQGVGAKGPWTIYQLKIVGDPQEPTGFDPVNPGDKVTISQVQNGKYTNLNYEKVESQAPAAQAQQPATTPVGAPAAGSSDPRVVKLLVVIAEQIGVDKNQILNVLGG